MPDLLHCADLGVGAYVGAQLFEHILKFDGLETGERGATLRRELSLKVINDKYEEWCTTQGSRTVRSAKMAYLGLSNIVGQGGRQASLKGKALECRVLRAFATELFANLPVAQVDQGARHWQKHAQKGSSKQVVARTGVNEARAGLHAKHRPRVDEHGEQSGGVVPSGQHVRPACSTRCTTACKDGGSKRGVLV